MLYGSKRLLVLLLRWRGISRAVVMRDHGNPHGSMVVHRNFYTVKDRLPVGTASFGEYLIRPWLCNDIDVSTLNLFFRDRITGSWTRRPYS